MFYKKIVLLLIACCWFTISVTFAQDQKLAASLALIYQQNNVTGTAKLELLTDLSYNETRDLKKGLLLPGN